MKRVNCLLLAFLLLSLAAACGGGAPTPDTGGGGVPTGGGETGGAPPAAPTPTEASAQADVPIMEGAIELKITSGGNLINYQVEETTVDEVTKFYQEALAAMGWEQLSKRDSGFGDSITLLRSKPDQNISVTIQSIAGSNNVRVMITLAPK